MSQNPINVDTNTPFISSIIVYGEKGCGKTRNAQRIADHFGLTRILDDVDPKNTPVPSYGHLLLVSDSNDPAMHFTGVKVINYHEVIKCILSEPTPIQYENNIAGVHIGNLLIAGKTLTDACFGLAFQSGWWNNLQTGEDLRGNRNVPELLCLIHSEVSEAMEGHRKNLMDDKLPHRKMIEVELADAAIRIFDMAGGMGYDLAGAIAEKLQYNASRADHKPENRKLDDGKKF